MRVGVDVSSWRGVVKDSLPASKRRMRNERRGRRDQGREVGAISGRACSIKADSVDSCFGGYRITGCSIGASILEMLLVLNGLSALFLR